MQPDMGPYVAVVVSPTRETQAPTSRLSTEKNGAAQLSFHDAPIFRLLLKIAVF